MENVEIEPKIAFDESMQTHCAIAEASANIALIKYWGKCDEQLILPYSSSLSLTLGGFSTKTSVHFDDSLEEDSVCLNNIELSGDLLQSEERARIVKMLDIVRKMARIESHARVVSKNTVPTAAGLASSASGFAALAAAAAYASGLRLNARELSILARKGSGSACRSIYGGLVLWNAGVSSETSYAEPIESPKDFNLAMVAVVLNPSKKKISSRKAMRQTVETSQLYKSWIESCKDDIATALQAIKNCDLEALGEVSERNALGMHAAMRAANPSVDYLSEESHAVLRVVLQMRGEGWPVWATMDAGPNVKVLTSAEQVLRVKNELRLRVLSEIKSLRESQKSADLADLPHADFAESVESAQSNPQFVIARPGDAVSVTAYGENHD